MAKGINKVILVGRVGKDPDVRSLPNGNTVATFSLATNRKSKGRDGNWVEKADWHRIKAWGKLGEICRDYVKKGKQIFVDGRIEYGQWTDQNNTIHYTTDIVANEVLLLSGGGSSGFQQGGYEQTSGNNSGYGMNEPILDDSALNDEIPF